MPVFFLFFTRLRGSWVGEAAQFHAELRVFERSELSLKEAQEAQDWRLVPGSLRNSYCQCRILKLRSDAVWFIYDSLQY